MFAHVLALCLFCGYRKTILLFAFVVLRQYLWMSQINKRSFCNWQFRIVFFSLFSKLLIYTFLNYKKINKNKLEHARSDQTGFFNEVGSIISEATKNFKKRSFIQVLSVYRVLLLYQELKCAAVVHCRDGNRPGRPAPVRSTGNGPVAGRVEILRPAGQAGRKTGPILLSGN